MGQGKDTESVYFPARIATVQLAINFEYDPDINLRFGSGVLDLAKELKAEVITPSIPQQAPPESPRTVLKGVDATVTLSPVRALLSVNPPSHVRESFNSVEKFCKNRAGHLTDLLDGNIRYEWAGVVLDKEYAARQTEKAALQLCEPLFDSILNIDRNNRRLASFQASLGFTERGFHRNFNISGYDTREFLVETEKRSGWKKIDVDDEPVSEAGIKVRVDINNKPKDHHLDLSTEITELWDEHRGTFDGLEAEIGLGGLLK